MKSVITAIIYKKKKNNTDVSTQIFIFYCEVH